MENISYPLPGEKYKHYKGGTYEIIAMATHAETQEKMVVYKSLNFGTIYVRPYDIWKSPIDPKLKYTKRGETNTRFTKID